MFESWEKLPKREDVHKIESQEEIDLERAQEAKRRAEERLKIQNNHNFMTPEQFEKSKPFRRLVTAIKFNNLLDKYRDMKNNSNSIIRKYLPKLNTDLEILEEYVRKNFKDAHSSTQIIMDLAESQNLWDYEHMDAYNRIEKELEQYSFLQYLKVPSYWDKKAEKEINSIITKMLYVQKTVRGLHDNIEKYNRGNLWQCDLNEFLPAAGSIDIRCFIQIRRYIFQGCQEHNEGRSKRPQLQ